MKQSYSNVAFFAIVACVAYIAVAAAMPPPPPPSPTVSNTESGSSTQGIQYGPSGPIVFESQTGSSQGNAGNYQFSSGEDTLAVQNGILSGNGASEGSTGVLKIPFVSPALPQFNTLLPEPFFIYY